MISEIIYSSKNVDSIRINELFEISLKCTNSQRERQHGEAILNLKNYLILKPSLSIFYQKQLIKLFNRIWDRSSRIRIAFNKLIKIWFSTIYDKSIFWINLPFILSSLHITLSHNNYSIQENGIYIINLLIYFSPKHVNLKCFNQYFPYLINKLKISKNIKEKSLNNTNLELISKSLNLIKILLNNHIKKNKKNGKNIILFDEIQYFLKFPVTKSITYYIINTNIIKILTNIFTWLHKEKIWNRVELILSILKKCIIFCPIKLNWRTIWLKYLFPLLENFDKNNKYYYTIAFLAYKIHIFFPLPKYILILRNKINMFLKKNTNKNIYILFDLLLKFCKNKILINIIYPTFHTLTKWIQTSKYKSLGIIRISIDIFLICIKNIISDMKLLKIQKKKKKKFNFPNPFLLSWFIILSQYLNFSQIPEYLIILIGKLIQYIYIIDVVGNFEKGINYIIYFFQKGNFWNLSKKTQFCILHLVKICPFSTIHYISTHSGSTNILRSFLSVLIEEVELNLFWLKV